MPEASPLKFRDINIDSHGEKKKTDNGIFVVASMLSFLGTPKLGFGWSPSKDSDYIIGHEKKFTLPQ